MSMHLNREENYKHQKLSITVLSKALDDICPTFESEPEEIREHLIKERIKTFRTNERELDKEWRELENEALAEVRQFKRDREKIFKKLEKTVRTKRIELKVKELQHRKQARLEYLQTKKETEELNMSTKLNLLPKDSRKYTQLEKKLKTFSDTMNGKMRKVEARYNTIINNTLNSDNSKQVELRLKASHEVWKRKYEKLKRKFKEREAIHNHKRFELDQVRLAIQGFEEETVRIRHWCVMAGVSIKSCYTAVKQRIMLLEREIPEVIENLSTEDN